MWSNAEKYILGQFSLHLIGAGNAKVVGASGKSDKAAIQSQKPRQIISKHFHHKAPQQPAFALIFAAEQCIAMHILLHCISHLLHELHCTKLPPLWSQLCPSFVFVCYNFAVFDTTHEQTAKSFLVAAHVLASYPVYPCRLMGKLSLAW